MAEEKGKVSAEKAIAVAESVLTHIKPYFAAIFRLCRDMEEGRATTFAARKEMNTRKQELLKELENVKECFGNNLQLLSHYWSALHNYYISRYQAVQFELREIFRDFNVYYSSRYIEVMSKEIIATINLLLSWAQNTDAKESRPTNASIETEIKRLYQDIEEICQSYPQVIDEIRNRFVAHCSTINPIPLNVKTVIDTISRRFAEVLKQRIDEAIRKEKHDLAVTELSKIQPLEIKVFAESYQLEFVFVLLGTLFKANAESKDENSKRKSWDSVGCYLNNLFQVKDYPLEVRKQLSFRALQLLHVWPQGYRYIKPKYLAEAFAAVFNANATLECGLPENEEDEFLSRNVILLQQMSVSYLNSVLMELMYEVQPKSTRDQSRVGLVGNIIYSTRHDNYNISPAIFPRTYHLSMPPEDKKLAHICEPLNEKYQKFYADYKKCAASPETQRKYLVDYLTYLTALNTKYPVEGSDRRYCNPIAAKIAAMTSPEEWSNILNEQYLNLSSTDVANLLAIIRLMAEANQQELKWCRINDAAILRAYENIPKTLYTGLPELRKKMLDDREKSQAVSRKGFAEYMKSQGRALQDGEKKSQAAGNDKKAGNEEKKVSVENFNSIGMNHT